MSDRPMHTVPGAFQKLQQLYHEGEAHIEQGELELAVAKFTEGLAIDDHFRQRYVTMYAQRAFALQRLGRFDDAARDYAKAIEMEPDMNQAQYLFHRGMCHAAMERPADAARDYTASIAIYPDHPGPYHLRGKLYADKLEMYAEAVVDFDKLLSMRPSPDGYMWRGIAKYELKRYAEARLDFEASHQMSPDPHNVYMLAYIGAALGDEQLLVRAMKDALAMDPGYVTCFKQDEAFERFRGTPAFRSIVGASA